MGICSTSLNFHIDKGCAYIASTLGEVDSAFCAEDGGVKVSSSLWKTPQSLSRQLPCRGAYTQMSATSYRETSPHQSLRDSFSSRRSRLAAHCLPYMAPRHRLTASLPIWESMHAAVTVRTRKVRSNRAMSRPRRKLLQFFSFCEIIIFNLDLHRTGGTFNERHRSERA